MTKREVTDAVNELRNHAVNQQLSSSNLDAVEIVLIELERLQDEVKRLKSKAFLGKAAPSGKRLSAGYYHIGDNMKLVVE